MEQHQPAAFTTDSVRSQEALLKLRWHAAQCAPSAPRALQLQGDQTAGRATPSRCQVFMLWYFCIGMGLSRSPSADNTECWPSRDYVAHTVSTSRAHPSPPPFRPASSLSRPTHPSLSPSQLPHAVTARPLWPTGGGSCPPQLPLPAAARSSRRGT